MMFWNRKKRHEEKDEIIDKYKRKEQEYRFELEQKNNMILQYLEKESRYLDQNNDKEFIQELQQKVAKYEQMATETTGDSKGRQQIIEELQQDIAEYEQKAVEYNEDLKTKQQLIEELQQKLVEYEQKAAGYNEDLKTKQQLIEQLKHKAVYKQNETENTGDPKGKQKLIKELQHKITEYEQREIWYKSKLSALETNLRSLPKKQQEVATAEGHFKTMDRISKKLSNEQTSSVSTHKAQSSFQTRTPQTQRYYVPNQTSSQMVQFNPFKRNQGR